MPIFNLTLDKRHVLSHNDPIACPISHWHNASPFRFVPEPREHGQLTDMSIEELLFAANLAILGPVVTSSQMKPCIPEGEDLGKRSCHEIQHHSTCILFQEHFMHVGLR